MMIDLPGTITAVGVVITAIGAILASYWSYRSKEKAGKVAEQVIKATDDLYIIRGEIRLVGDRVDGRLSELLEASNAASRAEGVAAGEQSQRDRAAPSDLGR